LAGCFVAHRSKTTAGILPLRFAHPAKIRSSAAKTSHGLGALGLQYQLVVEIVPKYPAHLIHSSLGILNRTLAHLGNGRLDLVYFQNPGLHIGDRFPLWTLH